MKNILKYLCLFFSIQTLCLPLLPNSSYGKIANGGDGLPICRQANLKTEECPENVTQDPVYLCCDDLIDLEPVLPDNIVISPNTTILVNLEQSSVGPYQWTAGGNLSWQFNKTTGPENYLISSPDSCGMSGNITVSDACTNTDTTTVKSTAGIWVLQDPSTYDECAPPGIKYPNPSSTTQHVYGLINGEWKIDGTNIPYAWVSECEGESGNCPKGLIVFETDYPAYLCETWGQNSQCTGNPCFMRDDCCVNDSRNVFMCDQPESESENYIRYSQKATSLWHWECK